jgi:hypothetical protein
VGARLIRLPRQRRDALLGHLMAAAPFAPVIEDAGAPERSLRYSKSTERSTGAGALADPSGVSYASGNALRLHRMSTDRCELGPLGASRRSRSAGFFSAGLMLVF